MITLYSGTPGSGKSLHLAKDVSYWLTHCNVVIISNFEINREAIKGRKKGKYIYCDNSRLTPERIFDFCARYNKHYYKNKKRVEGRFILLLDEAQLLFNAREWQVKNRGNWLRFFTEHRKVLLDIYLICQFDRMLDRNIRACIEYECIHRKVSNYGTFGFFVGLLFGGNIYVYIKKWYPLKMKVESQFFIGRKKFFNVYDTYAIFDNKN